MSTYLTVLPCGVQLIGLLVSTPYMTVELNQAGIQSLQGFHYAVITETIFSHSYAILHTFPAEIAVMLREINNGVYHPGPYYFSKAFVLVCTTMSIHFKIYPSLTNIFVGY